MVEIFEKGNGLQFIKVGAEVIRLSKAIEKGECHGLFFMTVCADRQQGRAQHSRQSYLLWHVRF